MSGRARKGGMARGRPPREAQSGAPVEGQQYGTRRSRYRQWQQVPKLAPEPSPEPAPEPSPEPGPVSAPTPIPVLEVTQAATLTQAQGGAETLTLPPPPAAAARALTWSERVVHSLGRARTPAQARAPIRMLPPPPTTTVVSTPAARASTPAPSSELVRYAEPRGAEGGAEEGASAFPEEEGQVSARSKEPSQKKQSSRKNFHDVGVNTREKLHHFIECKRGTSGTVVHLKTNHFRLTSLPQWVLYQYHVDFNPQMDSKRLRSVLLDTHRQLLGKRYSFDGTILFSCHKLQKKITEVFSQTHSGENVRITITLTNELLPNSSACLQFYNIIFKRLLNVMKLVQIGRNFYDIYNGTEDLRDLGLSICPGFITSILQYENDIMLCTDVIHKVVRNDTVLDLIKKFQRSPRTTSREAIWKEIAGQIVYTKHNNRTYRVDGIDWKQTPQSTFKKDGSDISFLDYYRKQYGTRITDLEQPVLVSLPKRKKADGTDPSPALLMPELCNLTGLTRSMRRNNRITKGIANCTRLSPERRHSELRKLIDNIHRNADVRRELQEWGLDFEKQSLSLTGRVLPVQKLNEGSRGISIQCTEWSKEIKRVQLNNPKPLTNWLLVFNKENSSQAKLLQKELHLTAHELGIKWKDPVIISDVPYEINTYLEVLKENITKQTQIVVCLLPNNKKEKYDAIKRFLCVDYPVPSQCIVAETLNKPHILLAVVNKLVLQMNCKMGGHLWKVSVPFKDAMFIGIDCYHDISSGHQSAAGFVASLDASLTKWYSHCVLHKAGQELLDGLSGFLETALEAWKENNKQSILPKIIFVYRDGIGDGQLETMVNYEVPQILNCLNSLPNYSYKLVIIVVKKRVNTRFFAENNGNLINPNAGTVIDVEVTRPEWYDFFIISQSAKAGSVTPTHYNVVFDNTNLKPDQIQCLTYKLCYMYYNWTGVIRVPAPCQYAHKLAFLVGQNVRKTPSKDLSDRLYFL
ncbi:piwi-like protein 1 [Sarcophilus harrisii]|uniref:Piwi like RNA-mediated gene silencing 3 n=1 Tax=Sarcophilus harrisii TaxID=9305 RepID=G3WU18_SARHA|nr:piwi-like protein 1 [Sarcophilus harrisii]